MSQSFFTIGVYGTNAEQFFEALRKHGVSHFIDIRQRRGLRGSQYSYANASALQRVLGEIGVQYVHLRELAPTDEIRQIQKRADASGNIQKQNRRKLASGFVEAYRNNVWNEFDLASFLKSLPASATVVFFCVEREAEACHRSIVLEALSAAGYDCRGDITP